MIFLLKRGLIFISLFAAITTLPLAAVSKKSKPIIDSSIGKVVLISRSDACSCTTKKIEEVKASIESSVLNLTKKGQRIDFEVIDYSVDTEKTGQLMKGYGLDFIPCVLLLGNDGKVYYKISYYFENKEYLKALDDLVHDSNNRSKK